MKHFSVPAPSGSDRGRSFLWDDDDGMTQEGFKRFRRRNRNRQVENGQKIEEASTLRAETPHAQPPAQPSAKPDEQSPPAAKPKPMLLKPAMASVSAVGVSEVRAPEGEKPLPENVVPQTPNGAQTRERRAALPTRFDPWLQLPQVPFDFLGQKPSLLPLVSAFRSSPTARAFDLLRTRLLHSLKDHGWKRVAITSPTAGGGTTFCAVNLALSLARVPGSRTVLMDMNFRRPGVAAALGIPAVGSMVDFLAGELALPEQLQRLSDSLAVATNRVPEQGASDILHAPSTAEVLDDMIEDCRADTVLFDLPPVLENDDVPAFLPQVDGVLLISDGDQTTAAQLAACEKMLAGHAPLLGVVLNRAQQTDKTQVTP